jgi:hypothetical protein
MTFLAKLQKNASCTFVKVRPSRGSLQAEQQPRTPSGLWVVCVADNQPVDMSNLVFCLCTVCMCFDQGLCASSDMNNSLSVPEHKLSL